MICEFVSSFEGFFFAKDPLFIKLFNVVVYSLMTFLRIGYNRPELQGKYRNVVVICFLGD